MIFVFFVEWLSPRSPAIQHGATGSIELRAGGRSYERAVVMVSSDGVWSQMGWSVTRGVSRGHRSAGLAEHRR